jgi:GT2 family glycosyltransferase
MTFFAMVTTRSSAEYTPHALRSFFAHTPLEKDDRFFLIDNDGGFEASGISHPCITLVRNPAPLGWAANVNPILRQAAAHGADICLLNNDVIFTPNWFGPLAIAAPAMVSSVSNFQFPYQTPDFVCEKVMDLADYLGHEKQFDAIAAEHAHAHRKLILQFTVWLFCIRIPLAVYQAVGPLDESFGRGGGEDMDYCLRCHLAGFPVCFATESFVLHFVGKSTWRGGEDAAAKAAREQAYRAAFVGKWGRRLAELAIDQNLAIVKSDPALEAAYARRDFRFLVEAIRGGNEAGN